MVQIVTPNLPDPCNAVTYIEHVDPSTLTEWQKVGIDAVGAEIQRLYSAVLQVGNVLMSISEVEREAKLPYNFVQYVQVGELLAQVSELRDLFDEMFRLIKYPWLQRSEKARRVVDRVTADVEQIGA